MKKLQLTIKKKWFDMIVSGEKTEEYREIKLYWFVRLTFWCKPYWNQNFYINFDSVVFRNGYRSDSPTVELEYKGTSQGIGKEKWGAPKNKRVFIIKLGKIIK